MKLRKLLAVTAVAATMTAAFAVNAMADTTNNLEQGKDFTYDASTGIITITADGQAKQHTTGDPYTMLVVVNDMDPLEDKSIPFDTSFIDTDIKQIDQADAKFEKINVGDLTAVSNCAECTANKAEKCSHTRTYEIRLGGDGNVRWGTLTVKGEDPEPESPYDDPNRLLGDVNYDKAISVLDVGPIISYTLGVNLTGDDFVAADTNKDDSVSVLDVGLIISYTLGDATLGNVTISQK